MSPDLASRARAGATVSAALYVLYALAASAALVEGTTAATVAGAGVAAYLLLRLAWSTRRLLAARTTVAAALPAGPTPPAGPTLPAGATLPARPTLPAGRGRP